MEEKAGISIKEFCDEFKRSYRYAYQKLQRLLKADSEMKKHISRRNRQYVLDEYAVFMLLPNVQKKAVMQYFSPSYSEHCCGKIEKELNGLKEKQDLLRKKQEAFSEETEMAGLNLIEFSRVYECNYEAASRRLKKLLETDKDMKNHVFYDGNQYTLDRYAINALIPKKYVKRKEKSPKPDCLKGGQKYLAEKEKDILNAIRQKDFELISKRMELIGKTVYRCLGRMYIDGDEMRLEAFLAKCADFKSFMNNTNERED